jgi:hypothetical protein
MAPSVFDDKAKAPAATDLKKELGGSAGLWIRLIAQVTTGVGPVSEEWNFAGAKHGWSMRLRDKERVVLYMTPQDGCFLVGVVLGEKAVKRARE